MYSQTLEKCLEENPQN